MKNGKRLTALLLCICLAFSCAGCAVVETVEKQAKNVFSFLPFGKGGDEPSPSPSSAPTTASPTPSVKPMGTPKPKPSATPSPEPEHTYYFIEREDGKTAFLVEYAGPGGDLTIPGEYKGKTVTSIYEEAFLNNEKLTGVTVPDSVDYIEKRAFSGCRNLRTVKLPKYLYSICDEVFFETALEEIALPDSVTAIGDSAFEGCAGLKEVKLPEETMSIGDRAFARCEKLEKVTIPPSVTGIGADAFQGCKALTIYGFTGSEAEVHAKAQGISFVSIGGSPTPAPTPKPTAKPAPTPEPEDDYGDVWLPAGVIRTPITLGGEYNCQITLYPNGSFELFTNLYEGYGSVYGTYQAMGSVYEFTVTDRDFYGFIGDDVWMFWMEVDGNTLTYSGEQIGTITSGQTFC